MTLNITCVVVLALSSVVQAEQQALLIQCFGVRVLQVFCVDFSDRLPTAQLEVCVLNRKELLPRTRVLLMSRSRRIETIGPLLELPP